MGVLCHCFFWHYHDAQGFPALDFLIHGVATGDALPIDKFTTHTDFNGFTTYLADVVAQMITLNDAIVNNWESHYNGWDIPNIIMEGTVGSGNKFYCRNYVFNHLT